MIEPLDQYRGHICVTEEPGCTCKAHADALRERDALRAELRAELAAERERRAALEEAGEQLWVELQDAAFGWDMVPDRVKRDAREALDAWRALLGTPRRDDGGEVEA